MCQSQVKADEELEEGEIPVDDTQVHNLYLTLLLWGVTLSQPGAIACRQQCQMQHVIGGMLSVQSLQKCLTVGTNAASSIMPWQVFVTHIART